MVAKRKYKSGKTVWYYLFSADGATREDRKHVSESGFSTRKEAVDAEAARRIKVAQDAAEARGEALVVPKSLGSVIADYLEDRSRQGKSLALKTLERYHESVAYLSAELLAMPIVDVTALQLHREWGRLLESGGKDRKGAVRPLAPKTVRNIAGVVSSTFGWAVLFGMAKTNPVTDSELPAGKSKPGISLTVAQQDMLLAAASSPWGMDAFLQVDAATGARRGEVLATRWSDIVDGRVYISRSISQTKEILMFKSTKKENVRWVSLPGVAQAALEAHRVRQEEFRKQFGADYRRDLDLVFCTIEGEMLRPDSVSSSVSHLFRRLKLPKGASLHTLRHSHGSHLLAAGLDLPAVAARLGHASVQTTARIYAHVIPGRDDKAAEMWERFQGTSESAEKKTN